MDVLRNISVPAGGTFGPLQTGFQFDIRKGYTALVGPNNAGKSAILQLIFRFLMGDVDFGASKICLLLTDREYHEATAQPGGRTLADWNNGLLPQVLGGQPLSYATGMAPPQGELTRLLLHRDLMRQMRYMEALLPRVGLAQIVLTGPQSIRFDDVSVAFQGSGLRASLPILAATTDFELQAILIDEPELSLEPRLQKALRDVLIETAERVPVVVVSTHSHLFLKRDEPESTQIVTRTGNETSVETVATKRRLYDVTFDLLGSSTEDLFFPRNYLIVEGASDQVIMEHVIALIDPVAAPAIKVLSAQGIDEVRVRVVSVLRALVPLVVNDSPYAKRVVALIDQPAVAETGSIRKLEQDLGDRLYTLDEPSIEAYIPSIVFERAGRSKDGDLARMGSFRNDLGGRRAFKAEVSAAVAAGLVADDLDAVPVLRDAARRALEA